MSSSVAARENPYTIGVPVEDDGAFFGREELFESVRAYLLEKAPVTVIRGQRRIGKSSVLRRIERQVGLPDHRFVLFDLQAGARSPIGELLATLGETISDKFPGAPPVPAPANMEYRPSDFVRAFLWPLLERYSGTLVLLFDEFDALGFQTGPESTVGDQFASTLLSGLSRLPNLRVIAVTGRNPGQLDRLPGTIQSAPQQELGLLDAESAARLIRLPARELLRYDNGAVDAIQALACGHPYFTQLLCFSLFQRAKAKDSWTVSAGDVEAVVADALVRGRGGLTWFRDGLPVNERVMFSACAEARGRTETTKDLLTQSGAIWTDALDAAEGRLRDWGYLKRDGSFAVDLVGKWLLQEYPLREEIRELEKAVPEAEMLYQQSREARDSGDRARRKDFLLRCLHTNPNHVRAVAELAAAHFEDGEYRESVKCYQRASRFNPSLSGEHVDAIIALAESLIKEGANELAREVLTLATSIQPADLRLLRLRDRVESWWRRLWPGSHP